MATAALRAPGMLPACPGCAGGGEVNGLPCRDCGGSTRAGLRVRRWSLRKRLRGVALAAAGPAGAMVGWSRIAPSLAGAAMVSLGAAMIYSPAGVIAGGGFLLWIGTELQRER